MKHDSTADKPPEEVVQVLVNRKCTECGVCVPACPTGSIFAGLGQVVISRETCLQTQVCVQVCPFDALTVEMRPVQHPPDTQKQKR